VAGVYSAIEGTGAKFTDPCFVQAAADFQNLVEKEYFSQGAASDDYGTAQAIFLSGQAAFFQTGSWFASGWDQTPPEIEIGIMPFPRMADSAFPNDVTGAVTHTFGIPTAAENPEAAMAVLDWMASPEGAAIWAQNGNLSMVAGAVDTSAPQTIKDLWTNVKAAQAALPWIENELPPGVGEDKVYTGTVALITGDMTPEQFSQSIQEALDASRT
jgi:raffinose/stachyose/melibiose transport system substrate-binding protein